MCSDIFGSLDFMCQYKELFKLYLFRGSTLLMSMIFNIFVYLSLLLTEYNRPYYNFTD